MGSRLDEQRMTLIDARNAVTSADDIERGLTALAMAGDNSIRAAELIGISASTLRNWRLAHADRYEEIRLQRAPELERLIGNEARSLAIRYAAVEHQALDTAESKIGEANLTELSGLLKAAVIGKGVNLDKMLTLDGRPTNITEHRSRDDIFRELERDGLVNSTAEDITHEAFPGQSGTTNARELEAG